MLGKDVHGLGQGTHAVCHGEADVVLRLELVHGAQR